MTERESTSHVNAMRDEIERLRAKITRLEAEVRAGNDYADRYDQMIHQRDKYKAEAHLLTRERDTAEAEVATLREAAEAVDQEWIARGDGGCSTKLRLALHTALATPTATAREGE